MSLETEYTKEAALKAKLPTCDICGERPLDYVQWFDSKGNRIKVYCTKHEIADDAKHQDLQSAVAARNAQVLIDGG